LSSAAARLIRMSVSVLTIMIDFPSFEPECQNFKDCAFNHNDELARKILSCAKS
jgi:hypothetical protein